MTCQRLFHWLFWLFLVASVDHAMACQTNRGQSPLNDDPRVEARAKIRTAVVAGELSVADERQIEPWLMPSLEDRIRIIVPANQDRSASNESWKRLTEHEPWKGQWKEVAEELGNELTPSPAIDPKEEPGKLQFEAFFFRSLSKALDQGDSRFLQQYTDRRVINRVPQDLEELNWPGGSYSQVTTRHFEVFSRAPAKQSANLAELCEQTYCVWQQLFDHRPVSHWQDRSSARGASPPFTDAKFRVVLFRNKEEYVRQLQQIEPNIGISTGYYSPKLRSAFFYWEDARAIPTMRHELVHQFFNESTSYQAVPDLDQKGGIWAIEGIAMYFESMSKISEHPSFDLFELGGWDSPRLQAARFRRLHDEFWIPFAELHGETGQRLRSREDIGEFYSQAAGVTHWMMDGGFESREVFRRFLQATYRGNPDAFLPETWDSDLKILSSYDSFLTVDARRIRHRSCQPDRIEIALPRTVIDSEVFEDWTASCRKLAWLDLSFTQVDDAMFKEDSGPPWDVVRLSLEGSRITDESLQAIGKMPRLEELDLSGCAVTDEGLAKLQGLGKLKVLWLTNTSIGDPSIGTLRTLRSLEHLEITGSQITDSGRKKLEKALPKWKNR